MTNLSSSSSSSVLCSHPSSAESEQNNQDEILFFRYPQDDSSIVLFGLPTAPFALQKPTHQPLYHVLKHINWNEIYPWKSILQQRQQIIEHLLNLRRARGLDIPEPQPSSSSIDPDTSTSTTESATTSTTHPAVNYHAETPSNNAFSPVVTMTSPGPNPPPPPPTTTTTATATSPSVSTASPIPFISMLTHYHNLHLQSLHNFLYRFFEQIGLVYEIGLKSKYLCDITGIESTCVSPQLSASQVSVQLDGVWKIWCFVRFYSTVEAQNALKIWNSIQLSCEKQKGRMKKSQQTSRRKTPVLALHCCLSMCTYFLGFQNWCCSIEGVRSFNPNTDHVYMNDEEYQMDIYKQSQAIQFKYSFTAQVLMTILGTQFTCYGVGHAERGETAHRAKKRAVTNAYRNLFASIALIRLQSGHMAVLQLGE